MAFPDSNDVLMRNLLLRIQPGAGWRIRRNERYSGPTPIDDFLRARDSFVVNKLQAYRVDPDWETVAAEIAEDLKNGKMEGPFASPTHWPKASRTFGDLQAHQRAPRTP